MYFSVQALMNKIAELLVAKPICAENYEWLWRRVVYFSDDYEQRTCI